VYEAASFDYPDRWRGFWNPENGDVTEWDEWRRLSPEERSKRRVARVYLIRKNEDFASHALCEDFNRRQALRRSQREAQGQ
jgi:hypothetical protein